MRSLTITGALSRIPQGSVLPTESATRLEAALGRLLARVGASTASRLPVEELAAISEVPLRVAERVVAARALARAFEAPARVRSISSSEEALSALPRSFIEAEIEFLLGLALSAQLVPLATFVFAKGGDAGALVTPKDVFVPLVRTCARAFVLAHNHPSGDPTPSPEDIALTNRLAAAGDILGIALVDHLVVSRGGTVSFCEIGLLPAESGRRTLAAKRPHGRGPTR